MDIILLKDLEKVGNRLEVVTVKNGYGRNYLIPKGFAMIANKKNVAKIDAIKQKEADVLMAKLEEAKAIATKIEGVVLKIGAKAGTSGKIFGSVTNVQLSAALKDQLDIDVERRIIEISDEVKNLGTYRADINLHPDLDTKITFEVVED